MRPKGRFATTAAAAAAGPTHPRPAPSVRVGASRCEEAGRYLRPGVQRRAIKRQGREKQFDPSLFIVLQGGAAAWGTEFEDSGAAAWGTELEDSGGAAWRTMKRRTAAERRGRRQGETGRRPAQSGEGPQSGDVHILRRSPTSPPRWCQGRAWARPGGVQRRKVRRQAVRR